MVNSSFYGRLLKPGDTVEHEGATFRVERVERRRLRWVRLTPAPPESPDGAAGQATLETLLPLVTTAALTGAGLGMF
ncbi:MAG: Transporter associated domain [Acidobacteriota bacterium]|nr:Transporter associated domain [Acidobacteriota bacterium]